MKDTVYVLRPGFEEEGHRWFCPYSAQVIGFLTYYPHVRDTIELVELAFPRPRHPLVDLLGPDHQAAPMLVIHGAPARVEGVVLGEARGHTYVEKTVQILRYLAATRKVPGPH
jgi:hypothetical protein